MYSLPDSVRKARESHLIDRVWFRGKCLKQGIKKSEFCLKQGRKISDFCLKQGQGMRGGAAPPHPKDISSTPPGVYIQQKYRDKSSRGSGLS